MMRREAFLAFTAVLAVCHFLSYTESLALQGVSGRTWGLKVQRDWPTDLAIREPTQRDSRYHHDLVQILQGANAKSFRDVGDDVAEGGVPTIGIKLDKKNLFARMLAMCRKENLPGCSKTSPPGHCSITVECDRVSPSAQQDQSVYRLATPCFATKVAFYMCGDMSAIRYDYTIDVTGPNNQEFRDYNIIHGNAVSNIGRRLRNITGTGGFQKFTLTVVTRSCIPTYDEQGVATDPTCLA